MSDSTPPARWEEATMELRQVMGTVQGSVLMGDGHTMRPTKTTVVVGVQQKWLVQDGPRYPKPIGKPRRAPTDQRVAFGPRGAGYSWYVPARAEWRDLPTVTPVDLAVERRASVATPS